MRCVHHKNISSSDPSTACRTRLPYCIHHRWAPNHFPLFPLALQSDLPHDHQPDLHLRHLHTEILPAPIHRMSLPVLSRNRHRLQVMSSKISLKATLWSSKSMFFHKPSMTSTFDTSDRIATHPPESDLDDEQIRNMLAPPLYLQEREASADRSRVYHSFRENWVCSSSPFRESAGKPAAVFSHKRKSSQDTSSDREGISSGHQTVQGKVKFSSGSLIRKKLRRQFLRNKEIINSQKRNLKSWSECKVDTPNTCIREFQRQAHSNRLELDSVNFEYEESRRAQARLHEELAQREKALRDTRIRNIHEVEELKRVQGMRTDEFSRHELTESHATIQDLTSQIQDLQGRTNCKKKSFSRISRWRINLQCKIVPRSQWPDNYSKSWWDAGSRPKFATWYMEFVWYVGKRFWQSTCSNRFVVDTLSRYAAILWIKVLQAKNPVRECTGNSVARGTERNRETIPNPTSARRPSTMNSLFPAEGRIPPELHGWSINNWRSWSFILTNSPTPSSLSCWKMRFKTQVRACSSSSLEATFWIKEVEMVDSVDDVKSSRAPRPPVSTNCQSDFGEVAFTGQNYDGCTSDKIRQHIWRTYVTTRQNHVVFGIHWNLLAIMTDVHFLFLTMTSHPFTQHLKSIFILRAACWPTSSFFVFFFKIWSLLFHIMDWVACWTSPGDVHGLLGNAALEHVDMLVDKGPSIHNTMHMKSGIDNALLRAADPLLQSFMKLDERGGFYKQPDMERGLLFANRARGSEERWRAQGHDISEMSYKIRVMLSHLHQKKGFKATASRPHPFLAKGCTKWGKLYWLKFAFLSSVKLLTDFLSPKSVKPFDGSTTCPSTFCCLVPRPKSVW